MGKCLSSPAALVVYIPLEASPTPPRRFDAPMATMLRGRMHIGHTESRVRDRQRGLHGSTFNVESTRACVHVCRETPVRGKRDNAVYHVGNERERVRERERRKTTFSEITMSHSAKCHRVRVRGRLLNCHNFFNDPLFFRNGSRAETWIA